MQRPNSADALGAMALTGASLATVAAIGSAFLRDRMDDLDPAASRRSQGRPGDG